jgi:hypothetical protein
MGWISDLLTPLYAPLGTTSNYSAIANLHTLQITTAPDKPFSSLMSRQQQFRGNGFEQWRFFSFPRSGTLVTAAGAELLSMSTQLQRHLFSVSLAELD